MFKKGCCDRSFIDPQRSCIVFVSGVVLPLPTCTRVASSFALVTRVLSQPRARVIKRFNALSIQCVCWKSNVGYQSPLQVGFRSRSLSPLLATSWRLPRGSHRCHRRMQLPRSLQPSSLRLRTCLFDILRAGSSSDVFRECRDIGRSEFRVTVNHVCFASRALGIFVRVFLVSKFRTHHVRTQSAEQAAAPPPTKDKSEAKKKAAAKDRSDAQGFQPVVHPSASTCPTNSFATLRAQVPVLVNKRSR